MKAYKPADHEVTTSVAPLMQFFELVHIGDTIQSMVQVYFDKELVKCFFVATLALVTPLLGLSRPTILIAPIS